MGMHAAGRRRQIAIKGRSMVLRRRVAPGGSATAVTLTGFPRGYRPDEIAGGIQQGDQTVAIMDDEIAAAGWPGPPRKPDEMVIDGAVWIVQGAEPVYEGATLLGFNLWVRGGK